MTVHERGSITHIAPTATRGKVTELTRGEFHTILELLRNSQHGSVIVIYEEFLA